MQFQKTILPNVFVVFLSALGMFLGHWLAAKANLVVPPAQAEESSASQMTSTRLLELVDQQGKRRALIGTSGEGSPAIWFFDQNGKSRLNLGLYGDGTPMIVLNDANEQAVQIFRTVGGDSAPVLVMKTGGQDRIIMGLNEGAKDPYLVYFDAQGAKHSVFGNRQ